MSHDDDKCFLSLLDYIEKHKDYFPTVKGIKDSSIDNVIFIDDVMNEAYLRILKRIVLATWLYLPNLYPERKKTVMDALGKMIAQTEGEGYHLSSSDFSFNYASFRKKALENYTER